MGFARIAAIAFLLFVGLVRVHGINLCQKFAVFLLADEVLQREHEQATARDFKLAGKNLGLLKKRFLDGDGGFYVLHFEYLSLYR